MEQILFLIGTISLVVLVLLLLASWILGHDFHGDFDVDVDHDPSGADGDSGNALGWVKSILVFVGVGSWVTRAFLQADHHFWLALLVGVLSGVVSVYLLAKFLGLLLQQQEEGNWKYEDAVGKGGEVYLTIPKGGEGEVQISVKGAIRTLVAISDYGPLPTGTIIEVKAVDDMNRLIVMPTGSLDALFQESIKDFKQESEKS